MHRSADDAVLAFRDYVRAIAAGERRKHEIVLLLYQPELEPQLLVRLPGTAAELTREGVPVEVIDLGPWFVELLVADSGRLDAFRHLEAQSEEALLDDLGQVCSEVMYELLTGPLPAGVVARLIVNTGVLASLISYSAITSDLAGSSTRPTPPTVLAFPGEGDDRAVNLLGLRLETNYRIARI